LELVDMNKTKASFTEELDKESLEAFNVATKKRFSEQSQLSQCFLG